MACSFRFLRGWWPSRLVARARAGPSPRRARPERRFGIVYAGLLRGRRVQPLAAAPRSSGGGRRESRRPTAGAARMAGTFARDHARLRAIAGAMASYSTAVEGFNGARGAETCAPAGDGPCPARMRSRVEATGRTRPFVARALPRQGSGFIRTARANGSPGSRSPLTQTGAPSTRPQIPCARRNASTCCGRTT